MQRSIVFHIAVATAFMLSGCRTPPPSFNPFAGYGSPRVPPPATGSYGAPNSYYPNNTVPPTGGAATNNATLQQAAITIPTTPQSNATTLVPSGGKIWRSPSSSTVAAFSNSAASNSPVAQAPAVPTGTVKQPSAFSKLANAILPTSTTQNVQATYLSPTTTKLNPMPVNDATSNSSAIGSGVAQVPNATRSPTSNPIRGFSSTPRASFPAPGVVSAPTNTSMTPGVAVAPETTVRGQTASTSSNGAAAEIGWKPKYSAGESPGGTIIR